MTIPVAGNPRLIDNRTVEDEAQQFRNLVDDLPGGDLDGIPDPRPTAVLSTFRALPEKLGLKLEPASGSRDFLVIDSVEKTSGN